MPILTLQKSMRRLGRIRMGSKATATKNGRQVEFPKKLETWRMTSPSRELLEAAAGMYGGEVVEWAGSPSGKQWELFTDADSLEVVIPPGDMAFSQWFEMWSGGGCSRRCDGETEITSGEPCMCPADPEQRIEMANKGQACKPTTRLFVIQPRLPDVGLWHFESHGFYAATEIPGTINIIQAAAAAGNLIPARLRIEQRTVKRDGKTNSFAVPVIELPTLSTHSLMTGEIPVGELGAGLRSLPAGESAGDAPEGPQEVPEDTAAKPTPSAHDRVMAAVTDDLDRAAAGVGRGEDAGLPLPSAGSGDGANMRRTILAKAKRHNIDGAALEELSLSVTGKRFAEIADSEAANKLLKAVS